MSDPVTSVPDSETDEDSDSDVDMGCSTANEAANEDPYSTQALEEHERRLYEETPATQLDPRPEQPNNRDRNNDDSVMPHNTSGGTGDTMFLYPVLMRGGGGGVWGRQKKLFTSLMFSDWEPGQRVVEQEEHRPVAQKLVTDSLPSNWGECNCFQVGSHAY